MQQLHPHQLSLPVSSQTQCLPPPEVVPAQSVYVVVKVEVVLQFRQGLLGLLGKHFAYNSHIRHRCRCRVCAKQKNPVTGKYKDTKTVTRCDKCGVHLCIADCFEL